MKTAMVVAVMAATMPLTSCDVMLDVLGGMTMGMSGYSPYYTPSYSSGTNNNYLLDPNYAIWQTQQQQAQMNQVQQQLIDKSIKQTEEDMKRLNEINKQLIETSIWQAEHGINLGGTGEGGSTISGQNQGNGNNNTTTQSKTHQCGLCKGSGRTIKTDGTSFGNTKWCSECGKTVPDYHYHSPCESCGGKGSW